MKQTIGIKQAAMIAFSLAGAFAFAQGPVVAVNATMKQVMLDLIHPASNEILLLVNRGGPKDAAEWASARRSAVTLQESGNLLALPGRARDQGNWMIGAKTLADIGAVIYKAAQAKDAKTLASLTDKLDAACTNCHKQYRPNVFPRVSGSEGGSK